MTVEVKFKLAFGIREDSDAEVHVGYCPLLQLYSQGQTEEEAEAAITDAAQLFIVTCYGRDTLHRVLRERGMIRAVPGETREEAEQYRQFISVQEFKDYNRTFERDIPIDLLAAAEVGQEMVECP
jgi:predicted RNase H-like HicB family nuclease